MIEDKSDAVVRSMFEINQRLSPLRSWVQFPVRPIPHVREMPTLFDSVGVGGPCSLLYYITNRPILSIELIMSCPSW
jgi:hypothetical protein